MPDLNMALKAVDQLETLVLVDNISDFLTKTPKSTSTEKQNLMKAGMKELSGCCLCSAIHGLSLLIKVQEGNKSHVILFDAGPDEAIFSRNIKNLNVDSRLLDAICLSHGHWDHAGGFLAFKDLSLKRGQIPFHAHSDVFVRRGSISDDQVLPYAKIPSQHTLEQMGFEVCLSRTENIIKDVFFLSGEVPRITEYEIGFPGHMCWNKEDQKWIPDPLIIDEKYLVVNVAGKGLVVISACSHAGIINVLEHVSGTFKGKIHAVIGGLHLAGPNESIIDNTINDLEKFSIDKIIPAHCTGIKAVTKLMATECPSDVELSAVGKSFIF